MSALSRAAEEAALTRAGFPPDITAGQEVQR